jgi:nicotinate-nucleotide adenylyltransferase
MKIALYSGSFNPVHIGHTKLAACLIETHLVDEVWFVVSPCNPLKNQNVLLDEYLRLDMLILAVRDTPVFKASDVEFTMPVPSYTIDTLNKLTAEYPDHQFSLIIGSDNALVFDKWKNYSEILNRFPVYVYPRRSYDFSEVAALYPQMQLLETPYFDISSTQIRESIAQKKDVTQWLHPQVLNFILENNLYC